MWIQKKQKYYSYHILKHKLNCHNQKIHTLTATGKVAEKSPICLELGSWAMSASSTTANSGDKSLSACTIRRMEINEHTCLIKNRICTYIYIYTRTYLIHNEQISARKIRHFLLGEVKHTAWSADEHMHRCVQTDDVFAQVGATGTHHHLCICACGWIRFDTNNTFIHEKNVSESVHVSVNIVY